MCGAGRRKSAPGCDRIVAADFRPKLARRSWCRRRRGRAGTRPDHPPGSELDDRRGVLGNSRRRVDDDQLHVASAESLATRPQPAPQGGRTCRAASSDRRKPAPAGGARTVSGAGCSCSHPTRSRRVNYRAVLLLRVVHASRLSIPSARAVGIRKSLENDRKNRDGSFRGPFPPPVTFPGRSLPTPTRAINLREL
jgi:hypothetical protein